MKGVLSRVLVIGIPSTFSPCLIYNGILQVSLYHGLIDKGEDRGLIISVNVTVVDRQLLGKKEAYNWRFVAFSVFYVLIFF